MKKHVIYNSYRNLYICEDGGLGSDVSYARVFGSKAKALTFMYYNYYEINGHEPIGYWQAKSINRKLEDFIENERKVRELRRLNAIQPYNKEDENQ